jgi:hypothetical protein
MNKNKTCICSLIVILFFMVLSCENSMTDSDEVRNISNYVPVTDVGEYSGFELVGDINDDRINNENFILKTKWGQGQPYNDYLNKKIIHPTGWYRVLGCGPVAIGQIIAFHGANCGKPEKSPLLNYTYNWSAMVKENSEDEDKEAIGQLFYEIYRHAESTAIKLETDGSTGKTKEGGATATTRGGVKRAFIAMGYETPENFKSYNFSLVKSSIRAGYPVLADGSASGTTIFGITIATPIKGHYWVIDGYRRMKIDIKNDKGTDKIEYPTDFVHCNMGWGGNNNGWYINGVFNTNNIPWDDTNGPLPRSATVAGLYQYGLGILTGIKLIEEKGSIP